MIKVGAATIDITPPAGMAMSGFASRTDAARGAHDPLTVRALAVEDTALATVDVIGIDAELSARARSRCTLPDAAVTIAATHTHGGPASMSGRLSATADPAYIDRIENAIVRAVDQAVSGQRPARLRGGAGAEPGFARNRRIPGGPVDRGVPVLRFDDAYGEPIAVLVSYACHPVVLGPDNLNWTGDYPHCVRARLEAALPGAVAIFATGCAGDVNTGHSAAASLANAPNPDRSFARAQEIGLGIARSAMDARLSELSGGVGHAEGFAEIAFEPREDASPRALAGEWRRAADGPGAIEAIWADWAETRMGRDLAPRLARVTALSWGGAGIVALPGEIFAATGLDMRRRLAVEGPLYLLSYADDNPGYIPPRAEYAQGGYEVDEAHRYYGLGATVAPGTAERLAATGYDAAASAGCFGQSVKSRVGARK